MPDEIHRLPVVEEEARIIKRATDRERVTVRTSTEHEDVVVHEQLVCEAVEVVRVPVDREVSEAPAIRTEGDVTIVPILEERLVVERRLFVVEELHLTRHIARDEVSVPATLRRTRVEVTREHFDQQEDY